MEIDDMFDDDEDRDISMSLSGKVEKQEPVAWSRLDTAKSVITENEDIKRGWDLDGLPFKCLFDSPQPCPECDEKQSAIDVWEGRYADKTAECEKLKAERDELAAQVEKMQEALTEVDGLIGESSGIYGLHLNGDPSPWGELLKGGRFERLSTLHEALALPDISTRILNRVRAESLRKAADICNVHAMMATNKDGAEWANSCETAIRALAADMEAGKC